MLSLNNFFVNAVTYIFNQIEKSAKYKRGDIPKAKLTSMLHFKWQSLLAHSYDTAIYLLYKSLK